MDGHGLRQDSLMLGESQSRIILSVKSADREKIGALAGHERVPCSVLGFVSGRRLMISIRDDRGRRAPRNDLPCDKLGRISRGGPRGAPGNRRRGERSGGRAAVITPRQY